jgi:hypothetical protein
VAPSHPFFNAGAAPKKRSHPLIEASQPGGWMERAGSIGTAIAGLPGAIAKGVYDEYANSAKFLGKYMKGDTATQLRGNETITDNGDVYRDGKLVGNMLMDKDALVRSSTNVADLAPVSAIGSGAARLAKGQKAVDPNTLHMFIGPKGATAAEKKLLDEAKDMAAKLAKEGMSPEEVRILTQQKTGWAHNPAMDVWQMEISDLNAKVKPEFVDILADKGMTKQAATDMMDFRSPNAMDHPELFERYPQMADTQVRPLGPYSPGYKTMRNSADFSPKGSEGRDYSRIRLWGDPSVDIDNADNPLKSVLLHEMQHDVQRLEGWPNGSNPGMFYAPERTTDNVRNMLKTTREMNPPDVLDIPAYKDELDWWEKKYLPVRFREEFIGDGAENEASRAARQMYINTAGETQARNVQSRLTQEATDADITNIMRATDDVSGRSAMYSADDLYPPAPNPARQRPFESTQDIPYERQHVVPHRIREGINGLGTADASSASAPAHPFFTPDMAEQPKPRKLNVHGDYVGAPKGVNTPEQEQAIIDNWVRLSQIPGAERVENFYDDFSSEIARRAGGNPQTGREYGMMMGNFSPLTDVSQNVNMANTAMNQRMLGEPINVEGTVTAARASANTAAGIADRGMARGPKAGPFSHNLISKDFPQIDDPQLPVMDTWMGRISGIEKSGGLSPENVRYLQENIEPRVRAQIGGDHKTAQARVWEGARLEAGAPPLGSVRELMDDRSTLTQMEAIPGSSTGSPLAKGLNETQKGQYTDEMYKAVGGSDAARMFGLADDPEPGFGRYDGHTNPNRTIRLSTGTDGQGPMQGLNPSSKKADSLMRKTYQMLFGQEGSGSTTMRKLGSKESIDNADAAYINMGQRLQGREMHDRVFKALEEELGPDWNNSVVPFQMNDGVGLFKISDVPNNEFQGLVQRVNSRVGGVGVEPRARVSPDYTGVTWSKANTGDPNNPGYGALLDEFDTPELVKKFDQLRPLFAKAQIAHETLAKKWGMTDRGVLDTFRGIAAREGLAGIRKAIRDGILPVAAIGFAAEMMSDGEAGSS